MVVRNPHGKLWSCLFCVSSPRMKIDNSETHVGAVTMSPYFNLYDNSIYVGGVPPAVGIDSIFCPVRISLIGGIRNLQINGG